MRTRAVVVGGSAGALPVLEAILPALPAGLAVPVVAVVHLPPDRPSLIPGLFGARLAVPSVEVEDKLPAAPGLWFAPPGYHLLLEEDGHFALSIDPPVQFARPSIDVLFESAARAFGPALLALLLSGANEDGAAGVREVLARGGLAVAQDPASTSSPEMPAAGLRAGARAASIDALRELLASLPVRPLTPPAPRSR